jgi:hypothetical protein
MNSVFEIRFRDGIMTYIVADSFESAGAKAEKTPDGKHLLRITKLGSVLE